MLIKKARVNKDSWYLIEWNNYLETKCSKLVNFEKWLHTERYQQEKYFREPV